MLRQSVLSVVVEVVRILFLPLFWPEYVADAPSFKLGQSKTAVFLRTRRSDVMDVLNYTPVLEFNK